MKKLAYIAALLFASGCDLDAFNPRSEHCPGYNSTFLTAWFPYSIGETYYFSTGSGSRDTLFIDAISQTAPYSIKEALDGYDESCHAEAQINTLHLYNVNRPGKATLEVKHDISGSLGVDVAALNYKRYRVSFKIINNEISHLMSFDSSDHEMEKISTVTLNGKVFNDVIVFSTTDTAHASYEGYDKMYISRNAGIVGYRTYPTGDVYAKE